MNTKVNFRSFYFIPYIHGEVFLPCTKKELYKKLASETECNFDLDRWLPFTGKKAQHEFECESNDEFFTVRQIQDMGKRYSTVIFCVLEGKIKETEGGIIVNYRIIF